MMMRMSSIAAVAICLFISTNVQATAGELKGFYDRLVMSHIDQEGKDEKLRKQIDEINKTRGKIDLPGQLALVDLYEKFLADYPESFYSFEFRRLLLFTYASLYRRTGEAKYKDKLVECARSGLIIARKMSAQYPETLYLDFMYAHFVNTLIHYDEHCPREPVENAEKFFIKTLTEDALTTRSRLISSQELPKILIYEGKYAQARDVVRKGLDLCARSGPEERIRENIDYAHRFILLYMATKIAILAGNQADEERYHKELLSLARPGLKEMLEEMEKDLEAARKKIGAPAK